MQLQIVWNPLKSVLNQLNKNKKSEPFKTGGGGQSRKVFVTHKKV